MESGQVNSAHMDRRVNWDTRCLC